MAPAGARADVGRVASEYGLLLADAPRRSPRARSPPGTVRVVASRASAERRGLPQLHRAGHRLAGAHRLQLWLRDQRQPRRDDRQSRRSRPRPGRQRSAASAQVAGRARSAPTAHAQPTGCQPLPSATTTQSGGGQMNAPFHARGPRCFATPSAPSSATRRPPRCFGRSRSSMAGRRRRSTRAAFATRSRRCRSRRARPSCSSICRRCGDPLNDINALAEVCEPGTVVIAAGQVNDVRLYRDLVASRHPGLSAEAVLGRSAARRLRQCADDHFRPADERERRTRSPTSWRP